MMQALTFILALLLAAPAFANDFMVVTGSFKSKANAEEQLTQLTAFFNRSMANQSASSRSEFSKANAKISEIFVQGEKQFRVSIGPFDSADIAEKIQLDAVQQGFKKARADTDDASEQEKPPVFPSEPELLPQISELASVEISRFIYQAPALEKEISALLLTVTGKNVETSDLLATKDSINRLYVSNGFVNTGMVIPDQRINNGELQLDFITGKITELQISSRLRNRYINSRLKISEPFNLVQLQDALKLLEQDPSVSRIDARVAAGIRPGEAMLALDVETNPRFSLALDVANDRSPSIGSQAATLTASASNLTGWGETLQIGSSVTKGLDARDATIFLPLLSGGTSLQIQYALSDSSVIEEPFDNIDVESETESLGVMLNWPIQKTLSSELSLQLSLDVRRNRTTLLGQPFSFSEGAINGESRVAPIRVAIAYTERNINDSLAARFLISRGTSKFDATKSSDSPDGQFTSYLAQVQYSRLLTQKLHITARALVQYAADPLLSIEKYALGGIQTIRGYRQNQVVRDNAYLASLEAHYRPDLPVWIDFIGFFDWGRGENHKDSIASGQSDLASIGVGVVVKPSPGFSIELYLAHGFDDFKASQHDLQDDGVHFRLGYRHAF